MKDESAVVTKYNFRLRFFVPKGTDLRIEAPEAELPPAMPDTSLTLKPLFSETIKGAERLYISGKGFDSENNARNAGLRTQSALLLASAESRIGANCGQDKISARLAPFLKDKAKAEHGITLHDDVHGLFVYPDTGADRFFGLKAEMTVGRSAERFLKSFQNFAEQAPLFTERQYIALELINSSHFELTGRARLLTLVTAMEVMCEAKESSGPIKDIVSVAMKAVAAQAIGRERDIVLSRISEIKKESIKGACKSSVGALLGEEAAEKFGRLYDVRSEIVHGGKYVEEVETFANEAYDLTWEFLTHGLRTLDSGA